MSSIPPPPPRGGGGRLCVAPGTFSWASFSITGSDAQIFKAYLSLRVSSSSAAVAGATLVAAAMVAMEGLICARYHTSELNRFQGGLSPSLMQC